MISYAQNFEDVILWRALGHVQNGVYIDIGANDPVIDSVSLAFYEKGWRGLHVEPMPEYAERLRAARPDEEVMQVAIAKTAGKIDLHEFEGTGLTTAIAEHAQRHRKAGFAEHALTARTVRLSTILKRFEDQDVHWMKVDVEGMEADVLASWGRSPVRPWVLVIESTLPLSSETNEKDWEELVLNRGYQFAYFDGLNRFYVHKSREDLLGAFGPGPNFFDGFSLTEHSPFTVVMREARDQAASEADAARRALADVSARFDQQAETIGAAVQSAADAAHSAATAEMERLLAQHSELQQRLDNLQHENAAKEASHAEVLATHKAEVARIDEKLKHAASAHGEETVWLKAELARAREEQASAASAYAEKAAWLKAEIASRHEEQDSAARAHAEETAWLKGETERQKEKQAAAANVHAEKIGSLNAEITNLREEHAVASELHAEQVKLLNAEIANLHEEQAVASELHAEQLKSLNAEIADLREEQAAAADAHADEAELLNAEIDRVMKDSAAMVDTHQGRLADLQAEQEELLLQWSTLKTAHEVALAELASQTAQRQLVAELAAALKQELAEREIELADKVEAQSALSDELSIVVNDERRLRDALAHLDTEVAELTRKWNHWRGEAHAYRVQLEAVRNSDSWRLSAPVRWVGGGGRGIVRGAKTMLRPGIEMAMVLVRSMPWSKRPLLAMANTIPPLRRKIDHFWLVRQTDSANCGDGKQEALMHVSDAEIETTESASTEQLSSAVRLRPRAAIILSDLELV